MKSKTLTFVVFLGVVALLVLPGIVLTQGVVGRVLNRGTRQVFTGMDALQNAVDAAGAGAVLLAAGNITETDEVDLTGFSGTIVGETRRGFAPTIRISGGLCPGGPVGPFGLGVFIDATGRAGAVSLIGLNIVVPADIDCIGVFSDANPNALTVSNCRFTQAGGPGGLSGIEIDDANGAVVAQNNTISGRVFIGIAHFADGAVAIDTFTGNRINNTLGGGDAAGIAVRRAAIGSSVMIRRNTIDGGGAALDGQVGIALGQSNGVTVDRNTIRNWSDPAAFQGQGIVMNGSPGVMVTGNALINNRVGILVDPVFDAVTSPEIHNNNIRSNVAGAIGLDFNGGGASTYPLNATSNYWGAASGPSSLEEGANTCPEATGASCLTLQSAATDGTGLPITNNDGGSADCGFLAGQVMTCPHRTLAVIGAGA